MKKISAILTVMYIASYMYAQTPDKISYQAVIRNSSSQLVSNHAIGVKISLLQGNANGVVVYTETQTPTTNANGLISIEIGGGAGFSNIDWANGPYFIKTETDPTGGTSYHITGTSQILTVPYALYATKAGNVNYNNGIRLPDSFNPNYDFIGSEGNFISFGHQGISEDFIGYKNNKFYFKDSPDGADITDPDIITGGKIGIGIDEPVEKLEVDGNVDLHNYLIKNVANPVNANDVATKAYVDNFDPDPTNELQVISLSNDTIYLSNGGYVKLPSLSYDELTEKPAIKTEPNIVIGTGAGEDTPVDRDIIAIGDSALHNNGTGATLYYHSIYNTALGSKSLFKNTIGFSNTAIGYNSLYSNTSGGNNTACGVYTLLINRTGSCNTAMGYNALSFNTTGNYNTATGDYALNFNISGHRNTAYGNSALYYNSTGENNTAIGDHALSANESGNSNVAVGTQALRLNTIRSNLVAIGDSSLFKNGLHVTQVFQATGNTAVGSKALFGNTTGYNNTATGYQALFSNIGGNSNTANGYMALYSDTSGSVNTAYGYMSLYTNTTGYANTASGYQSLYLNTIGYGNTANGYLALYYNRTGEGNTAVGYQSLNLNSSGHTNTAVGYMAGDEITTGSNNIAIGYRAQVPTQTGSNQIRLGNAYITYAGIQVPWTVTSDKSLKESIRELPYGLDFVNKLKPVDYIRKNDEKHTREAGFIAQDIEELLNDMGIENSGILSQGYDGSLELRYNDFISILAKAIQEQQELIVKLQNENDEFKSMISDIKQVKAELEEIKSVLKLTNSF